MPLLDHSNMLTVLNTRRQHCRNLLELSRRQRDLIDASDYSQLLTILGQKQRLLGRLDELNREHPDLKSRWKQIRDTGDADWRDDCEHVLAETESLLAELIEEEQDSTDHLTRKRDTTQKELQAVTQGSRVHDAYRESLAPATHRHLDIGQ
ncbi:MAG: flagellar export chaperone FlgN [Planctomycetaceae bacterium]